MLYIYIRRATTAEILLWTFQNLFLRITPQLKYTVYGRETISRYYIKKMHELYYKLLWLYITLLFIIFYLYLLYIYFFFYRKLFLTYFAKMKP